ncbi:hypothetical protein [Secundilactobacillus paracollinoides]|uniref:baeRF6 domain-containing protein n=1 Tax=Secundilactobacillus paracollinoides TaxID=240427 RepID=UPI0006EF7DEE|nr:hypothetical protein [Secundilactobacillus paracollinoides]KRL75706.1 hypothetical protein FC17_GL002434 [Secundilactobacillus paracollinoides DSM 15502 = JCM 11969]
MAKMVTLKELATLKRPEASVLTLSVNLDKLNYQETEQLKLKNALQEIHNLTAVSPEIPGDQIVDQINHLFDQGLPYRGLSIFANLDGDEILYLPRNSVQTVHLSVAGGPDLLSILKETPNKDYYLLQLEQTDFSLYRLEEQQLTTLKLPDSPGNLTTALGTEKRGGSLNYKATPGQSQYHGHNETSREKDIDQERYYRIIVDFLAANPKLDNRPIVLMGLPQNLTLFTQVAGNRLNLADISIRRSVTDLSTKELGQLAAKTISDHEKDSTSRDVADLDTHRLLTEMGQIRTALIENRIQQLVINAQHHIEPTEREAYDAINNVISQALAKNDQIIVLRDQAPEMAPVSAVTY